MNVKKLLIVPLFALLLSGCKPTSSSETPTTSESPVTSQTSELISPTSINISAHGGKSEIKVEETLQLTAEVLPAGAPQGVVWSSSHVERATVSEDGLVTGVDVGNVFIIATSSTNASVVKQFALKINEKDPEVILPESIVISAAGEANTVEIEGTPTRHGYYDLTLTSGLPIWNESLNNFENKVTGEEQKKFHETKVFAFREYETFLPAWVNR